MVDYYEALEISRSSGAHAIKIAYDAKLADLEASGLAEKDRRAAERALSTAYFILSNPQKRQEYDAKLSSVDRKAEMSTRFKPWLVPAIVAMVLIGGVSLYASDRARTRDRIRAEEARIAREAEM